MSNTELFHITLLEVFPDREQLGCISSPHCDEKMAITDVLQTNGQKRSAFIQNNSDNTAVFSVLNPDKKAIHLFAVDDCFFLPNDPKRCDCLVYDNHSLCFVELKLDMSSRKQSTRQLKASRDKLSTTILFFREAFSDEAKHFWGMKLEAYAAIPTHLYPTDNAERKMLRAKFLETYHVPLYEKNTKTF